MPSTPHFVPLTNYNGGIDLKKFILKLCPKLSKYYVFIMTFTMLMLFNFQGVYVSATTTPPPTTTTTTSTSDIWAKAKDVIVDIYNKIAGISTVLAGLMSTVAVIGAKMSNNQHKVDQAWDWLRRIWIAWAVINGIGAFIAYVTPLFSGLNKID